MDNQMNMEYSLIDYLLYIMEHPEAGVLINQQDRQIALQIKKIMDEMPGGFFIYRADGDEELIYANKAVPRLFNCSTLEEFREWTGNSFKGIVHTEDLEEVEQSIKEQIAQSHYDLDYVEYRIIQKGGEVRWVDDYGHFVHSKYAGDVFYVFIGDATDKKNMLFKEKADIVKESSQKEQKLKERIEEYNKEIQNANQKQIQRMEMIEGLSIDYESIFYADLDENTVYPYRLSRWSDNRFNEDASFWEYNGFDDSYINTWVHPQDRELVRRSTNADYIRKRLEKEKSFYVYFRVVSDNDLEHLQLRIVDVGNGDHVRQVVLGYRSVDEKIRSEMRQKKILELALNQAKSAIMAKDAFLANMSHDIRTPMNAIIGFTTLAKRYIEDRERLSAYLDQIENSSSQLMRLLQNVLEISRLEAGKEAIESEACNLIEILERVEEGVLSLAENKKIQLTFDHTGIIHSDIYSDRKKIGQILQSIVANAIKYTEPSGNVCLTAKEAAASDNYVKVRFMIEDNGIGISKEFLERIYEPFEREQNTTLSGVQGSGLGLTITKNFVDMMGGKISVQSRLGEGSCFTVTLSFSLQREREPAKEPVTEGKGFSSHKRVLLVEDNELNMEIESELLKDAGFLLDRAMNGRIAVDKVKNSLPGYYDLVLMDIQMPVMNGYEAAKAIRKLENPQLAKIPIIALSANVFEEDKRKSMESGMNLHMAKPLDLPGLLKAIQRILNEEEL